MVDYFAGVGTGIAGTLAGIVAIGYVAMKSRQVKRARRRAAKAAK